MSLARHLVDALLADDVAQTGGDKPPLVVKDPVVGPNATDAADDEDLDDEQEYEAEALFLTLNVHPLYERLEKDEKDEVDKRIAAAMKAKDAKEAIKEVVKGVLKDFYQTMYTRRAFWLNEL